MKPTNQTLAMLGVALGLFLLGSLMGHRAAERSIVQREAKVWQARSDSLLGQYRKAYQSSVDSLVNDANKARAQAGAAKARAARSLDKADDLSGMALALLDSMAVSAENTMDSLNLSLQVVAKMKVTEIHLRETIQDQAEAIASLEETIMNLEFTLGLSTDRIATLEAQLANAPKPQSCKILGLIPCPSRTTAAVLGALGGAILSGAIAR